MLRDIRKLSCSQEFMLANFGEHTYIDNKENTQPMYFITKDGFSFLVLGYNKRNAGKFERANLLYLLHLFPLLHDRPSIFPQAPF